MSRLQAIPVEEMNEAQRKVYDKIASGPRAGFRGPFNAWIRSPEYLGRLEQCGAYVRYDTAFPPRLSEFAILLVARHRKAQYVWFAHRPHAEKGGLDPAIIEAVLEGRRPEGMKPDEAAVYAFTSELLETNFVGDAGYREALAQFGEKGLVDLVGIIGHYTIASYTVNAFELPLPEGATPPFPR